MMAGERINIVGEDGQVVDIKAEHLQDALGSGFRLATPEENQAAADKAQYGEGLGNEIKAGLAGAARGATFGLSDAFAAGLGQQETLRKLQEQNPTASTVGELAGVAAPALLSGGAGAVGSGARVAGTGVRAAEAAGGLAESGVAAAARALGITEESNLLARTIAMGAEKAAGGAVQGVLYGGGQAISEAALNDKELTAEQIVQHLGASALLGGAIGGALGAGSTLGRAAVDVASDAGAQLRRALSSGGTAKDKIAKISSLISGHDEATIAEFANDVSKVHIAENAEQHIETAARKTSAAEDELRGILDDISDAGTGEGKRIGLRTKVDPRNVEAAATSSQDVVTGIRARIDNMLASPDEFTNRGALKKFDRELRNIEKKLANPTGSVEHANAEIYYELDNAKRAMQKITKSARPKGIMLPGDRATFDGLSESAEGLRTHLENQQIWGEAGRAQNAVNKAWTDYLGNERYAGSNLSKRVGAEGYEDVYQTDPDKVMAAFRRVGTPGGDLDAQYFAKRSDFRDKLLTELQSHYGDTPELAAKLERAKVLTKEIDDTFAQVRGVNDLRNKWQSLGGDSGIGAAIPGAAIGGLFGGAPGAFVGGTLGKALGSPQRTLKQIANAQAFAERMKSMSAVTDAMRGAGDRISKAVNGFIGKAKSAEALAPAAATIIDKPGVTYLRKPQKGEDEQDLHRNRMNELLALTQNPQLAVDRLSRSTQQLAQSHPQVSQAVQTKAMQVASFLMSKAPPTIQTQADMISGKTRPIAKTDLATFNRYVEAASDPNSVLDSLARGHVSVEAAETMRALYPKTVEQLKAKLIHTLSGGVDLGHKQRLVLSQFFDTPFSSTLEPGFLAECQANWNSGAVKAATQQAQNPQQAVRVPGLAKAQLGTDDQTKSERLAG